VLARLSGLRCLDASVIRLLEAQLSLVGGAGRLEGRLRNLRQLLDDMSRSKDVQLVGDLLQPVALAKGRGGEDDGEGATGVPLVSAEWGHEAREFLSHLQDGLFAWEAVCARLARLSCCQPANVEYISCCNQPLFRH
jgi:hypothetical protein